MRVTTALLAVIVCCLTGGAAYGDPPGGRPDSPNLALHQPARQSSTYTGSGFAQEAGLAVDGIIAPEKDPRFLSHTTLEANPWWQVDLGAGKPIGEVHLHNRVVAAAPEVQLRARTVQLLLSVDGATWTTVYRHDGKAFDVLRLRLAEAPKARFVRVQLAERNYLHLYEVEVYGPQGDVAPQQPDTPPAAPLWYTHPSGAYRFQIPAGWRVTTSDDKTHDLVLAPGRAGMLFCPRAGEDRDLPVEDFLARAQRSFAESLTGAATATRITLGGEPAVQVAGQFGADRTPMWRLLVCRGDHAYALGLAAPSAADGALPPALALVQSTFEFVGGTAAGGQPGSAGLTPPFDPDHVQKKVLVSQQVTPSDEPQTVSCGDRVKVTIPGGLLKQAQTLAIAEIPPDQVPGHGAGEFGEFATYDIALGDLHQFDQSLTIEMSYDPAKLSSDYSAADQIMGRYWDTPRQQWLFFPVRVDADHHRMVASVDHLTTVGGVVLLLGQVIEAANRVHGTYERMALDVYHTPICTILYTKSEISGNPSVNDTAWGLAGGGQLVGVTSVRRGWLTDETISGYRADVPAYIQDLGWRLDQAYANYAGLKVPPRPVVVKVDSAFLQRRGGPEAAGAYETVFDRIHIGTGRVNTLARMDMTTGHELFHAIQHRDLWCVQMFQTTSPTRLWWLEAEADYAACRVARSLNMMGGQGSNAGVNPRLLECPLPACGADASSPYVEMEYDKAHFIDYLVAQRGLEFRPLHEAVMSGGGLTGDPVLAPLGAHLLVELGARLPSVYRDFAAHFLLSDQSPIATRDPATQCAEASDTYALPAGTTQPAAPLVHTFQLPAQYTAKLWAVRAATPAQGGNRTVMVQSVVQPAETYLDLYLLRQGQRFAGTPPLKQALSQVGDKCSLTMTSSDVLYIVATNTSEDAGAEVRARVSDDSATLTIDPSQVPAGGLNTLMKFSALARDIPQTVSKVECEWDYGDSSGHASFFSTSLAGGRYEGAVTHRYLKAGKYTMTVRLYEQLPRPHELLAQASVPVTIAPEGPAQPPGFLYVRIRLPGKTTNTSTDRQGKTTRAEADSELELKTLTVVPLTVAGSSFSGTATRDANGTATTYTLSGHFNEDRSQILDLTAEMTWSGRITGEGQLPFQTKGRRSVSVGSIDRASDVFGGKVTIWRTTRPASAKGSLEEASQIDHPDGTSESWKSAGFQPGVGGEVQVEWRPTEWVPAGG
jgi:hypothetical protein